MGLCSTVWSQLSNGSISHHMCLAARWPTHLQVGQSRGRQTGVVRAPLAHGEGGGYEDAGAQHVQSGSQAGLTGGVCLIEAAQPFGTQLVVRARRAAGCGVFVQGAAGSREPVYGVSKWRKGWRRASNVCLMPLMP